MLSRSATVVSAGGDSDVEWVEPRSVDAASTCGDGLHIITQYYHAALPKRRRELQRCLRANLDNAAVAKVHVLLEEHQPTA